MTIANQPSPTENLHGVSVSLLGRRITCLTAAAIVEAIDRACLDNRRLVIAHYNVHSFNLSMQLPWFYEFLQAAEIAHCDGLGILKAIRWISGVTLPSSYRVSYSILMPQLLEHCHQKGLSLFLLGAQPTILQQALQNLHQDYPDIPLAGHHGYFSPQDPQQNEAVVEQINRIKPQIMVVGMGNPRQEAWIHQNKHRLDVNVLMAGGAIIDRLAGTVSECPQLLSNLGLEWMYRLCREPRRLAVRYLLGNPAFVLHIFLAKFLAPPQDILDLNPLRSLP